LDSSGELHCYLGHTYLTASALYLFPIMALELS
jgi:hypothetical protein